MRGRRLGATEGSALSGLDQQPSSHDTWPRVHPVVGPQHCAVKGQGLLIRNLLTWQVRRKTGCCWHIHTEFQLLNLAVLTNTLMHMCVVLTIPALWRSDLGCVVLLCLSPSAGQGKHCSDGNTELFHLSSHFDCVPLLKLNFSWLMLLSFLCLRASEN